MAACKNQFIMKYRSKSLVSDIVTLNPLFTLENLPL